MADVADEPRQPLWSHPHAPPVGEWDVLIQIKAMYPVRIYVLLISCLEGVVTRHSPRTALLAATLCLSMVASPATRSSTNRMSARHIARTSSWHGSR